MLPEGREGREMAGGREGEGRTFGDRIVTDGPMGFGRK